MRKNLHRTMSAALLTGGLLVATAGFAQAVPVPLDIDEEVRVGNLVSVPVKVCGNAINVLGTSDATCDDTTKATARTNADKALVSAPVTVCGNSVGVAGGGNGSCGTAAQPEPNGSVEAPVTVCGTSAALLGTASGDCGKSEAPEQPQPEVPEQPQPEQPEQPGSDVPGGQNPGGGNNGGGNDGGDDAGGSNTGSGTGQQASASSQQAAPITPLPRTGADPLEFLLFGATLVAAGAMARRGARRVES